MSKKILSIFVGIMALVLLAACAAPIGKVPANIRTMSVNGTGKITLVPDLAYISIGVRSEAEEVSQALNANNAQAVKISETLQKLGVEAKDIQTTNFNVYPMQQYDMEGKVSKTTYVVENTVNVTVRELSNLGKLLDATVKAGANNIYGISFDVDDKTEALDQARTMAIKDAQEKAKAIAEASGVSLGEIQSINVYSSGGVTPVYDAKYGLGGAESMAAEVPVSAGTLIITFEANLTYEIK